MRWAMCSSSTTCPPLYYIWRVEDSERSQDELDGVINSPSPGALKEAADSRRAVARVSHHSTGRSAPYTVDGTEKSPHQVAELRERQRVESQTSIPRIMVMVVDECQWIAK